MSVSVVKCNGYDIIGHNNKDGEWLSYNQFEEAASISPDCAAALLISMNKKNEKDRAINFFTQLPIELGAPVLNVLFSKNQSYAEELRKARENQKKHFFGGDDNYIDVDEPTPLPFVKHEMEHSDLNAMKFYFSLEPSVYEEDDSTQEPTPLCREMVDPLTEGVERYLCDDSPEYEEEYFKKLFQSIWDGTDPHEIKIENTTISPSLDLPEPSFLANTMARGAEFFRNLTTITHTCSSEIINSCGVRICKGQTYQFAKVKDEWFPLNCNEPIGEIPVRNFTVSSIREEPQYGYYATENGHYFYSINVLR